MEKSYNAVSRHVQACEAAWIRDVCRPEGTGLARRVAGFIGLAAAALMAEHGRTHCVLSGDRAGCDATPRPARRGCATGRLLQRVPVMGRGADRAGEWLKSRAYSPLTPAASLFRVRSSYGGETREITSAGNEAALEPPRARHRVKADEPWRLGMLGPTRVHVAQGSSISTIVSRERTSSAITTSLVPEIERGA